MYTCYAVFESPEGTTEFTKFVSKEPIHTNDVIEFYTQRRNFDGNKDNNSVTTIKFAEAEQGMYTIMNEQIVAQSEITEEIGVNIFKNQLKSCGDLELIETGTIELVFKD